MPELLLKVFNGVRRRPRVRTVNTEESKTVQSDVFRTEIKHIMAKYKQVGIIEHLRDVDLQFRDVSEFQDFADLMFQSKEAEKVFMELPSKVRAVFDHDVAKWLDAAHDSEKLDALRPKLEAVGVLEPEEVPVVTPVAGLQRRSSDGRFIGDEPPPGGSR